MSATIAITNQKGGVGKTTTAAALLCAFHQQGKRVLGVDLDPQGSLGFSLGLDIERCATIYDALKGQTPIEDVVVQTENGDVLPSNILLSAAELEFNRPGREFLLKNQLSKIADRYDYIIIDTPPALNVLTVNAYVCADALIIPMAPEQPRACWGWPRSKRPLRPCASATTPACGCWASCSTNSTPA